MRVDRVLGLGAVLLAIPVAVASWGFGAGSPKSPGAGFWPLLIALTMAGLGVSLILRPTGRAATAGGPDSRWGRLGIALGTLGFYVVTLEPLGYLLATIVLLVVQFHWVEGRSWRTSLWTAVLTSAVSLVLFRTLLKVPLPLGALPLPKGW